MINQGYKNWNIRPTDWELNKDAFEHKEKAFEISRHVHSLLTLKSPN